MADSPILNPLHFVEDLDAATDFERKHTPFIGLEPEGDKTKITVAVGHYVAHPNELDHFFNAIDVFVDDVPVAHFTGAPAVIDPTFTLVASLEPGARVSALASCNLHGVWKGVATL